MVYDFNFDTEDVDGGSRLPDLVEGQMVNVVDIEILQKETRPPARYTDATMLSAMENAGRLVENKELSRTLKRAGGIGTPATRAAILERLIKVGYVQRLKKALIPTQKGETLIDLVPDALKNVETTAEWENGLLRIEQGEVTPEEWLSEIKKLTWDIVANLKEQTEDRNFTAERKTIVKKIGICPLCGSAIIEGPKEYICSGWKDGCKLVIWKVISGKKITEKQVQDLLNKGKTRVIKFRMNSGGSIDAPLVVGVDGRISIDSGKGVFEQKTPDIKSKNNVRDIGILDGVFTKVIGLFKN